VSDYAWGLLVGVGFGLLIVLIAKLRDRRRPAATIGEQAEQYEQRRLRMLPAVLVIYLSQQAIYFSAADGGRTVDHVKIGAWALLTLLLMLLLVTRGFWFVPQAVRAMVEDEGTRLHRLLATRSAFIAAVMLGALVYTLVPVAPISARQALHLVISLSLGVGLLHFLMLERGAQRGLEA
jgi:hypothetical protein